MAAIIVIPVLASGHSLLDDDEAAAYAVIRLEKALVDFIDRRLSELQQLECIPSEAHYDLEEVGLPLPVYLERLDEENWFTEKFDESLRANHHVVVINGTVTGKPIRNAYVYLSLGAREEVTFLAMAEGSSFEVYTKPMLYQRLLAAVVKHG